MRFSQRRLAALGIIVSIAFLGVAPEPTPRVDPTIEARAKDWLHRAQTGNIERSQLSARVNAMLTPEVVKNAAAKFATLGSPTAFR